MVLIPLRVGVSSYRDRGYADFESLPQRIRRILNYHLTRCEYYGRRVRYVRYRKWVTLHLCVKTSRAEQDYGSRVTPAPRAKF